MIAATAILALLGCASATLLVSDGSSAAANLLNSVVPVGIAPNNTWSYGAHGTGAGIAYVFNATKNLVTGNPVAFGDDPLPAPLTGLVQIPVAIGAIAIYMNTGMTLPAQLTGAQLCTIFSGRATTWNLIDPTLPANPVVVVRRADSSGSTGVMQDYLTKICGFLVQPVTSGTIIGATGTGGMMTAIGANMGAIGYAVCGRTDANTQEIPLVNLAGNAVSCQTATYTDLVVAKVPTSAGDWSGVSVTNGAGANNFPMANILYGYALASSTPAGVTLTANQKAQGVVSKNALKYLNTPAVQSSLPTYFYYPLPSNLVLAACKTILAIKTSPATSPFTCPQ